MSTVPLDTGRRLLLEQLDAYVPFGDGDRNSLLRFKEFVRTYSDCFERSLQVGHLTASCFLLNSNRDSLLLTHHRKLGKWIQLGGHADGETDLLHVALKEAQEESGIEEVYPISRDIFDLDVHPIPERKGEPAHEHFDVRYVLGTSHDDFLVSDESFDLAWAPLQKLDEYTHEESVLRMRDRWLHSSFPVTQCVTP